MYSSMFTNKMYTLMYHLYNNMYVCKYFQIFLCILVSIYVCIYVCMYVCMYLLFQWSAMSPRARTRLTTTAMGMTTQRVTPLLRRQDLASRASFTEGESRSTRDVSPRFSRRSVACVCVSSA